MTKRRKNRSPQTPKMPRNRELMEAMQDLRRSNATVPQRNKTKYHRPSEKRARYDD